MPTFIGIESLAANALIELMEREHTREVSFDTLVSYGMKIVQIFEEQTGDEAILLLSEKYRRSMLTNYSEFFELGHPNIQCGSLRLKETASMEDLKDFFRWTMSVRLYEAFTSPDALRELGVFA